MQISQDNYTDNFLTAFIKFYLPSFFSHTHTGHQTNWREVKVMKSVTGPTRVIAPLLQSTTGAWNPSAVSHSPPSLWMDVCRPLFQWKFKSLITLLFSECSSLYGKYELFQRKDKCLSPKPFKFQPRQRAFECLPAASAWAGIIAVHFITPMTLWLMCHLKETML